MGNRIPYILGAITQIAKVAAEKNKYTKRGFLRALSYNKEWDRYGADGSGQPKGFLLDDILLPIVADKWDLFWIDKSKSILSPLQSNIYPI